MLGFIDVAFLNGNVNTTTYFKTAQNVCNMYNIIATFYK